MTEAIGMKFYGLKCDAPGCDHREPDVQFADCESWIDRPCPKCGGNLLTRGDYEMTARIMSMVSSLNEAIGPIEAATEGVPCVSVAVEMNGTGEVAFRLKP